MATDKELLGRRNVLKKIGTSSVALAGVAGLSSTTAANELCDELSRVKITVRALNDVEAEYKIGYNAPSPIYDQSDTESDDEVGVYIDGTVNGDTDSKDVYWMRCSEILNLAVDDTVGEGGASVAFEFEYEDTTHSNERWIGVSNQYGNTTSEYYIRTTGGPVEPDGYIESNDSHTGYTCEGYVSDDKDWWKAEGRFGTVLLEPNNDEVIVNREAN